MTVAADVTVHTELEASLEAAASSDLATGSDLLLPADLLEPASHSLVELPAPAGLATMGEAAAPATPGAVPEAPSTVAATPEPAARSAPSASRRSADPGPRPGSRPADTQTPGGCTAAQLRRFIKSRAYVPMHELRRRFTIDGTEDDVTRVPIAAGHVFVGLPPREGQLLGELLRTGDIGYELSLDPVSPIVIGVYPMRPVSRS